MQDSHVMLQVPLSFLAMVAKLFIKCSNDQRATQLTSMPDKQSLSSHESSMHFGSCQDVLGAQQM